MKFRKAARILTASLMAVMFLAGSAMAKAPNKAPTVEGVVNINAASPSQLELLPGIGPSKAKRIVDYRNRRKFKATYEVIRVKGIGRKTFRRLKSFLTVKGATTLTKRPARK